MSRLVFLYRKEGAWWIRRRSTEGSWCIEEAGAAPDLSASQAFERVQARLPREMVVVVSEDERGAPGN